MMKQIFLTCVCAMVIGCSNAPNSDQRKNIDVDIIFKYENDQLAVNKTVYVVEPLGDAPDLIVNINRTDMNGRVHVTARICMPFIVAIDGGGELISNLPADGAVEVRVHKSGVPSLIQAYGTMRPDVENIQNSEYYRSCGKHT